MTAFCEGLLAGYGIAIPVGVIAILIVETALTQGFSLGFMAGAGAATGDLLYAGLAAVAGQMLASFLSPIAAVMQHLSAVVLLGVGFHGLWRVWRRPVRRTEIGNRDGTAGHLRTYLQYLGLTMLNPLTVAYFGALILGGGSKSIVNATDRIIFVAGAGLASLSWQTLLAGTGALARSHLSPQFQRYASVAGNLIVIGFGLRIAAGLLA